MFTNINLDLRRSVEQSDGEQCDCQRFHRQDTQGMKSFYFSQGIKSFYIVHQVNNFYVHKIYNIFPLQVWNAESGTCVHTLYGHTSTVRCMHLHSTKVVSGSRDATLRMWDVEVGC